MKKEIEIVFLDEADEYFKNLPSKIQDKFIFNFTKTKLGYKGEWFKKLKSSDGIYEFRERDPSKFYRLLCFWDSTENKQTLIVGTHGFDKKSNQTPTKELRKAEDLKRKYFDTKLRK